MFRNPKTGKALGYWDDSLKFMGELDCFGNWKFQFGSLAVFIFQEKQRHHNDTMAQWYIIHFQFYRGLFLWGDQEESILCPPNAGGLKFTMIDQMLVKLLSAGLIFLRIGSSPSESCCTWWGCPTPSPSTTSTTSTTSARWWWWWWIGTW